MPMKANLPTKGTRTIAFAQCFIFDPDAVDIDQAQPRYHARPPGYENCVTQETSQDNLKVSTGFVTIV